jgi:hypothetical protein
MDVEAINFENVVLWVIATAAIAAYASFIWMPVVFLAYAAGRRQASIRLLVAFVTAEAIAIGLAIWIVRSSPFVIY